jgi:hypothetical protein
LSFPANVIPVFGSQRPYVDLNFALGSFGVNGGSVSSLALLSGFTFTRASLAMGYDATGKLTYGPNNQAPQSQTFDNASWTKSNATVTANAVTAPDGTATADKLVEAATVGAHYVGQTLAPVGVPAVASVYAKAGERTQLAIQLGSSSVGYFNLSNGTVVSGASAGISDAGNGWYRCWVSGTPSNQNFLLYTAVAGAASYTGDGTSGIYLWGAQLEAVTYQTTPSTYYPTTSAAYYGPRLVYDPVTLASLGILVEEARTNLCLQSQTFDNASWTKNASSIAADATTSPDGTSNADKLVEAATTAVHGVQQSFTLSAIAYTYSVYIKAAGRSWAQLVNGAIGNGYAYFNVSTGATGILGAGFTSSSIQDVGNGWYRCSVVFTGFAGGNITEIRAASANGTASYAGDGTFGLYLWQAQLELGQGASSPIPTTTAAVTRAADVAAVTGLSVPNPHSMAAEWTPGFDNASSFRRPASLTNSGATSSDDIYQRHTNNFVRAYIAADMDNTLGTGNAGAANKAAARFETNNSTGSLNGAATVAPDTSSTPTTSIDRLLIGHGPGFNGPMNGTISRIRIYNRALSDAQLQSLTS